MLANLETPDAPIICNGYKDDEFIEMALWATKLGRKVIIVVEKPSELDTIIRLSRRLARQAAASASGPSWPPAGGASGRAPAGTSSKFGLFPIGDPRRHRAS